MSPASERCQRSCRPRHLVDLLDLRLRQSGDEVALHVSRGGPYTPRTWKELGSDVAKVADGLFQLGVRPGEHVAHLAENRYEWLITDLALHACQAVHVPIHAPLTAAQVGYQIRHSGARTAIVSTAQQASKLAAIWPSSGSKPAGPEDRLAHVVTYDRVDVAQRPGDAGVQWHAFNDWLPGPPVDMSTQLQRLEAARSALHWESPATILYTSGTTGEPKGVVLTHGNLTSNAVATVEAFGMQTSDLRLSFLPLSHIFARTCDLYTWLVTGCQLALAQSRETVLADCQAVGPTVLSGVPYFFELARRALFAQGLAEDPHGLRKLFGGNMKWCCSGGAALPEHLYDFYLERGLPILQGYGLTETSPVISLSAPDAVKRGASGRPIAGVEVVIAADGEVLTRGPHVMAGYYQDAASTEEALRDGWFHTGDYGRIDPQGFLWITGRKKELIVTAAGKNVAPVLLESLLTDDPLIDQALVVGDDRRFLTALIVPNMRLLREALAAEPSTHEALTDERLLADPRSVQLVQQHVESRLADLSHHEQVRRITLLLRPFTIESGEMTPKLSLRRKVIQAHYEREIEAMYVR